MKSQSPYTKLGSVKDTDATRHAQVVPYEQGRNLFSMAHQHTGDWENWRAVGEQSSVDNPFLTDGFKTDGPTATVWPDLVDDDVETIEWFSELGISVPVVSVTSSMQRLFKVTITDVDEDTFTLTCALFDPDDTDDVDEDSTDTTFNATVALSESPAVITLMLHNDSIERGIDEDTWFVMWAMREFIVDTRVGTSRTTMLIPRLNAQTTSLARGEV